MPWCYGVQGRYWRELTPQEVEEIEVVFREEHRRKGESRTQHKVGLIYAAVALRIVGWSLDDIAEELTISKQRVSKICQQYRIAGWDNDLYVVRFDGKLDNEPWREDVLLFRLPHKRDTRIHFERHSIISPEKHIVRSYGYIDRVTALTGIMPTNRPPADKMIWDDMDDLEEYADDEVDDVAEESELGRLRRVICTGLRDIIDIRNRPRIAHR